MTQNVNRAGTTTSNSPSADALVQNSKIPERQTISLQESRTNSAKLPAAQNPWGELCAADGYSPRNTPHPTSCIQHPQIHRLLDWFITLNNKPSTLNLTPVISNTRLLLEHPDVRNPTFSRLARVAAVPILGTFGIKNRVARLFQNSITASTVLGKPVACHPAGRPLIPATSQVLMEDIHRSPICNNSRIEAAWAI